MKKLIQKIYPKRFGNYWKKIKKGQKLDKDLVFISDEFIESKSYSMVSNQWHIYNISHYKTLAENNLKKIGTTIFGHYHNFFYLDKTLLKNLYKFIDHKKVHKSKLNILKTHNGLDLDEIINHNYLLLLLFYNLKKTKYFKFLKLLKNKTYLSYGNPFIEIDDFKITSDKIISLFDLEYIEKLGSLKKKKILEIGAGSGRTSDCIMSVRNCSQYTICDIPPAIFLSYKRLKSRFPQKKITLLINENNPKNLLKKINDSDISFIFPHQLELIKEKFYDITIAIDCLHEMDQETLKYYFKNISLISNKIYFSIWKKIKNWYSGGLLKKTEKLNFDDNDYPVPKKWKLNFKKELRFPSSFYGVGYIIPKNFF
jgi:putative sugar O-methyltransferase